MNRSPPGFSVHGILQATVLEWIVIPFSRGSSRPKDQNQVSCVASRFFTVWAVREAHAVSPQTSPAQTVFQTPYPMPGYNKVTRDVASKPKSAARHRPGVGCSPLPFHKWKRWRSLRRGQTKGGRARDRESHRARAEAQVRTPSASPSQAAHGHWASSVLPGPCWHNLWPIPGAEQVSAEHCSHPPPEVWMWKMTQTHAHITHRPTQHLLTLSAMLCINWKKMHNLKVKSYILFGLSEDPSRGGWEWRWGSWMAERLFRRGKGETRLYSSFGRKSLLVSFTK